MKNSSKPADQDSCPHGTDVLVSVPGAICQLIGLLEPEFDFRNVESILLHESKLNKRGLFLCQPPEEGFLSTRSGRSYFFPHGIPEGKSIFVAASRLGQQLESRHGFFDALRTLGCRTRAEEHFLITAAGVSADRFVRRIGDLFSIPVCEFRPLPQRPGEKWLDEQRHAKDSTVCYYSDLRPAKQSESTGRESNGIDDLLIGLAAQVYTVSVNAGGNTLAALDRRLDSGRDTRLLLDKALTNKRTQTQLLDSGATAWWLYGPESRMENDSTSSSGLGSEDPGEQQAPYLNTDEIDPTRFLSHWTRRRVGPWPGQTEADFLDDLIFGASRAKHDPLAALCRILACQRIIASHDLARDQTPVVCLSGVPNDKIPDRRKFRPHLARWDFEPFGISIDRDWLKSIGASPVIYGDETVFKELSHCDRPFFQLKKGRSGIDWAEEQEWRLARDLDLRQAGPTDAIVFVPDRQSAEVVSRISRWPVVVLGN